MKISGVLEMLCLVGCKIVATVLEKHVKQEQCNIPEDFEPSVPLFWEPPVHCLYFVCSHLLHMLYLAQTHLLSNSFYFVEF